MTGAHLFPCLAQPECPLMAVAGLKNASRFFFFFIFGSMSGRAADTDAGGTVSGGTH